LAITGSGSRNQTPVCRLTSCRPPTFVMETGTHSPWVSRLLEALGHHVHVANAFDV